MSEIVGQKIAISEIASVYNVPYNNLKQTLWKKGIISQARGKVQQSKMEQKIYDADQLRESIKNNILGMYDVNKVERL